MRKTTIGLSEFFARGGALLANRRVRFLAAVLATALVAVTLSACGGGSSGSSAASRGPCDSYEDKGDAAPWGSDERIRYRALLDACAWGGVTLAEEIRQSSACLSYHRRYWEAPGDSEEEDLYDALWEACLKGGENLAEEIRQSSTCLSYHRQYWEAPGSSEEEDLYDALWAACREGGESLAEAERQNPDSAAPATPAPQPAAPATPAPQPVVPATPAPPPAAAPATPARAPETVAASFDVQAFETIADDMVAAMKEELGEDARPTLVIVPIESRVGENIDTQLINESVRIRLNKLRFFRVVSRNLETIMNEVQLAQSGLADSETAVEIGRLVGAQYVLYGTVANISGNQQTNYRIVLTLIEIETGFEVFVDAARVRK